MRPSTFRFIKSTSDGRTARDFRLVNRYSDLVLGLTGSSARGVETTPARHRNSAPGQLADGRTAAEQTNSLTPVRH